MGRHLMVFASVAHLVAYFIAAPEHVVDPSWPDHARFHLAQAIFWVAGLDVLSAYVAYRGGSTLILAAVFLTAHLSYFVSMLLVPDGRPPALTAHLSLGAIALVFLAGLALEL